MTTDSLTKRLAKLEHFYKSSDDLPASEVCEYLTELLTLRKQSEQQQREIADLRKLATEMHQHAYLDTEMGWPSDESYADLATRFEKMREGWT